MEPDGWTYKKKTKKENSYTGLGNNTLLSLLHNTSGCRPFSPTTFPLYGKQNMRIPPGPYSLLFTATTLRQHAALTRSTVHGSYTTCKTQAASRPATAATQRTGHHSNTSSFFNSSCSPLSPVNTNKIHENKSDERGWNLCPVSFSIAPKQILVLLIVCIYAYSSTLHNTVWI